MPFPNHVDRAKVIEQAQEPDSFDKRDEWLDEVEHDGDQ